MPAAERSGHDFRALEFWGGLGFKDLGVELSCLGFMVFGFGVSQGP